LETFRLSKEIGTVLTPGMAYLPQNRQPQRKANTLTKLSAAGKQFVRKR
jgi:hypothetical protein